MKRVIISGANGFIGNHCLKKLSAKGYEIHAVSTRKQGNQKSDITWHRTDLLSTRESVALFKKVQATHLLHFAWCTTPGEYWTSPDNLRWVQSSLAMLQVFSNQGGQRAVMAGSCAEYENNSGIYKEDVTPLLPATLYGSSKHALHLMLESFSRETKLSSAWGRLFHLYGPYEHPHRLVSSVILALLQGKPALCSHGRQVRDLLYVEDAAEAFVELLDSDISGPVNIASGKPIPLKEVITKIAEKLNRLDLVKLGARPSRVIDPHILAADVDRLLKTINWVPQYTLEEGLDRSITWWRKYLSGEKNAS